MKALRAVSLIAVALIASACSKSAPQAPAAPAAVAPVAEIAWRHGEVSEGLAEAEQSGKPVLLYWGAVWCPPCNQLKATVFKDPAFVAMTRDFIPIYLDGDEPGAQKWGEHFGVTGYPSLVILRADGTELTRLMGGLDLAQYPRQLALARKQTRPVGELLKLARSDAKSLSADDWDLLVNYGWPLDQGRTLPEAEVAPALAQLAALAPDAALRQRFAIAAWAQRLRDTEEPENALPPAERAAHLALLEAVLADERALRVNYLDLAETAPKMLRSVAAPGTPEWQRAAAALRTGMNRLQDDTQLSLAERLDALDVVVKLARDETSKPVLPETLVAQVHTAVTAADAQAKTAHERVAFANSAAGLLLDAGMKADAEALLRKEAEHSATGYYFMSDLAALAEERGDNKAALDWRRRAWQAAAGPATRTQWGVAYALSLLELSPGDSAAIEATVNKIIDEAAAAPDAYYRRTRVRFERLAGKLRDWSRTQKQAPMLKRLDKRMQSLCSQLPAASGADAPRASCATLLKA